MSIRSFIVPSSPIRDREIYATGANYLPSVVIDKIKSQRLRVFNAVSKVQEQKELVNEITKQIVLALEVFGKCCEKISSGASPKLDLPLWRQVNIVSKGFASIKKLQSASPKTHQYLSLLEDKFIKHFYYLIYSIENSTPNQFQVKGHLPKGFAIDKLLKSFEDPKYEKIPLVQTILNLGVLMNTYLEVYELINEDNYARQFPEEWAIKSANVSASGIAIHLGKRFELYTKLDVLIYIESLNKILEFEGSVVDIRDNADQGTERVAINFEFPDSKNQTLLQQEIQKQEVKECMKFALFS